MPNWFRRGKDDDKSFAIPASAMRELAPGRGACIATDRITVDGRRVGVMTRDEPVDDVDSGWQFLAGDETQADLDEPRNAGVYDVNTIANYDPDIIPFLDAPPGSRYVRWPLDGPLRPDVD